MIFVQDKNVIFYLTHLHPLGYNQALGFDPSDSSSMEPKPPASKCPVSKASYLFSMGPKITQLLRILKSEVSKLTCGLVLPEI